MTQKTIGITVNGLKHDIISAESINYAKLCTLAVQPVEYRPKVTCTLYPGDKLKTIKCGDDVPLVEGASYTVMLTGRD